MGVKLPSDADLGGLPSLNSGRPIANIDTTAVAAGGEALARGVTALGVGIEQHEEGRSRFELARAKADFLSAKIGLDEQYKEDQKWDDLPKRYGKDLNAAREAAINSISNPQAREQFRFTINPTFTQGVMGAEGLARTRQRDHFEADTFTRLNTLRDSALKSTDPDERTAAIQTGQEMIDGLVEGGVIDRAEGAKRKRAWAVDYAVAEVSSRPWGEQIEILRPAPQGEEGYYTRLAQVESGGNPNARATTSSAEGLYQFTRNTWLDTIRRHRPDLKEGRTDADLLALRRDPTVSREMVGYLTADNSKALSAAGVAVDPGSQYLAHFLGAGDAIKVLKAAPGTPVADIIGRDKIEANRSILEGKTAGTVASWAAKKMGSGGGVADFIPADKRAELLQRAETQVLVEVRRRTSEDGLLRATTEKRVADDLAAVTSTGEGSDLTFDEVAQGAGDKAAVEWQGKRDIARQKWSATHDLYALDDRAINERLASLRPKTGDATEGFAARQQVYDAAEKEADRIRGLRSTDPAGSVENDPMVRDAKRGLDPENAETWAPLVTARVAAQAKAGVPETLRSPITKAEAASLMEPLHRAIPGQERVALREVGKKFDDLFGDQADEAFAFALRSQRMDEFTARAATRILRKLAGGTMPSTEDAREVDDLGEVGAAEGAVTTAKPPAPPVMVPPARAITALRADPSLAAQFDAKYGRGAAKRILEAYPVR